ncbi:MAG TPA: hypothetical protein VHG32_01825 [Thermoanaerobaculia bacterium]|nr:hypothetical protein [Thermoanaerobaculia bacterium]
MLACVALGSCAAKTSPQGGHPKGPDKATEGTFFGTATLQASGEICLRLRTEEPGKPVAEGYRCYSPTDASYPAIRRHVEPIKVGEEKVIAPFE